MNKEMVEQSVPKSSDESLVKHEEIPFLDKWLRNDTRMYYFDNSYCFIREVRYPLEYQHGQYSFAQLLPIIEHWNKTSLHHPMSAQGLTSGDLFFFDTETTGLGGGAGNTIFLLGYAFLTETEVVVQQHILPQPGNEIPFYQSFLENINYETLVTYNGKSFDWPQLKTQHTLIREHVPQLPEFGHFDLYHASRRLWKDQLAHVKLAAVESEILDIKREEDIPGYLAPMIYFDFVERKDPEILFGILKHNELDVLSLICLYIHISKQILQVDGYNAESLKIANWLEYLGEKDMATSTYESVRIEGNPLERITSSHALAFHKKREKLFHEAFTIWKSVSENGNQLQRIEASIECAKLLEHQFKELSSAVTYAEKAYQEINQLKTGKSKWIESIERRLERLKRKQLSVMNEEKN